MSKDFGPPPKDGSGRPPPREPAHAERVVTTTTSTPDITDGRLEFNPQTRRWRSPRQESALRSAPLRPCGCIRDPDHDRHHCDQQISEQQLAGAVAAAHHLRDAGLPPMFDVPTLRAMWRAGHHQLVDELRGAIG